MKLELIATATFGLEAVVRREVEALGYKILETTDGRVAFQGDERAIAKSNLWLRAADRVYVKMGEFTAKTFEELFQQTKAIEWEKIIPLDGKFPVVGTSVKSELHSVPACQSIVNKAVASRLCDFYVQDRMPETGAEYRIRFAALKDKFVMMIDASGVGLHKRGYRKADVAAPIKETLGAALVLLSYYRQDKPLADLTCGSGTIPIEAAMIARNIAPGLGRDFASSNWEIVPKEIWKSERKLAYESADMSAELNIKAYDIDRKAIAASQQNADAAGVSDDINFFRLDMTKFMPASDFESPITPDSEIANPNVSESQKSVDSKSSGISRDDYAVVISNLPYGERIGDTESNQKIYAKIKSLMAECPRWSFYLITSDKELEKQIGRRADRRRKLYNGNIETQLYQYHGLKPNKKSE